MPDKSNKPFHFWQELNRRKVIRIIKVNAAISEIIDLMHVPYLRVKPICGIM